MNLLKTRAVVICFPIFVWPVYSGLLKTVWGFLNLHSPVLGWGLNVLLPLSDTLFYVFIYAHDTFVNLLLTLPFAIALRLYAGEPPIWSLFLASLAVFLIDYHHVIFRLSEHPLLIDSFAFWWGMAVTLLVLPAAHLLCIRVSPPTMRDSS